MPRGKVDGCLRNGKKTIMGGSGVCHPKGTVRNGCVLRSSVGLPLQGCTAREVSKGRGRDAGRLFRRAASSISGQGPAAAARVSPARAHPYGKNFLDIQLL